MAGRKTRSDSLTGQIEARREPEKLPEPPEGYELETQELKTLWRQFVSARSANQWRDFDLILVSKMVLLEIQIRNWNKLLAKSGPIIENKRGTMIENPLLRSVDTLQRQQLAIVRSISLGVSGDTGRELNKSGSSVEDSADLEKIKQGKLMSLVAK